MRPDAPRLSQELDRMARAALAQGQGDPVERMADHAEAAMAEAWNQALAQAMRPMAPAGPAPQAPAPEASGADPRYGAQGPIRPFQESAGPLPATRIPEPQGALAPGLGALPSGAALPPGGWPVGLFPPGVTPYGALPPGFGANWTVGQAPVLDGIGLHPSRKGLSPELQALIETKAAVHGLPAWLVKNVVMAESGGNPKATSPVGAQGLMQLMPETARELGVDNPYDAEDNLDGGVRYLKRMLDAFGGDLPKAVAAYNAGPGAVARHGGVPPYAETQAYVRRVLGS